MTAIEHEFDSILGEGSSYREAANKFSRRSTTPIVRLPDGSPAATVTLTSSVAAPADVFGDDLGLDDQLLDSTEDTTEEVAVDNPLLNNEILKRQHEKKLKREQMKATGGVLRYVKNPLLIVKGKDFSDITLTIFIPAVLSYVVLKKAAEVVGGKLGEVADGHYRDTASKIAFHAGDIEEMEALYKDCMKKTWFQGAQTYKGPELFKRVVDYFLKNKRVSPQIVSTLSYLVSVSKITDDEMADFFLELSSEEEDSTTIPLAIMFYSERIMKDKGAKKKLKPIMGKLSKRFGGEVELIKKFISDVGEQAYRDAIAAAGKDQTKLTEGWKVLGLDKETATNIFEEQKDLGFLTLREEELREERLRKQKQKAAEEAALERLRNAFDEEGNVIEPDEPEVEEEEKDEEEKEIDYGPPRSKQCTNCGFIIEVTNRPDEKFLLPHFKCPACAASKRNFKSIPNKKK